MQYKHRENLNQKIVGDRRDQRQAVREAGFADEAEAAAWARSIIGDEGMVDSELASLEKLRDARPDLTLRTVTYIRDQLRARSTNDN